MDEQLLPAELSRHLRHYKLCAMLPVLAGGAAAATWAWLGQIGITPLMLLASGAAGTAALTWLLGLELDQRFLPQLAQLRGITAAAHLPAPYKLLPAEVMPMGTQQIILNMVSGGLADRVWQAGFLECSRRDLQTGSTKAMFRGQVLQVQSQSDLHDFVLRPRRPGLSYQKRLADLALPKAAEVTVHSNDWGLYTLDHLAAADLTLRCRAVLQALPDPPESAQVLGIFNANGWLQLICANRRDLFTVWDGRFRFSGADSAICMASESPIWCEVAALALARFEQNPIANGEV